MGNIFQDKFNKMKIIYNISSTATNGGGMERVIVEKANYLSDVFGYEVIIITTDQKGKAGFYAFSAKIRHIDLDINYSDNNLKKTFLYRYFLYRKSLVKHRNKLESVLFQEKADIVISLSRDEKEFLYKIKDGSKKILESHRCLKPRARIEFRQAKSIILKLKVVYRLIHETRLPKYYDKLVLLTEEDARFWEEKPNRIVIPNPLPFSSENVAELNVKRVLSVGRISYDKGIDRLLKIWSKISPQFPDWKLSLMGDVVDKELITMIQELSVSHSVEILPVSQEVLTEYLSSSIYVMTSRFEGLPMVLLEAITCGLPIVSYAFKCGPSDVINDGVDGYLVEEGNSELFIKSLSLLMEDEELRKRMGVNAKINSNRFALDKIMNRWNDLFLSLLNG